MEGASSRRAQATLGLSLATKMNSSVSLPGINIQQEGFVNTSYQTPTLINIIFDRVHDSVFNVREGFGGRRVLRENLA